MGGRERQSCHKSGDVCCEMLLVLFPEMRSIYHRVCVRRSGRHREELLLICPCIVRVICKVSCAGGHGQDGKRCTWIHCMCIGSAERRVADQVPLRRGLACLLSSCLHFGLCGYSSCCWHLRRLHHSTFRLCDAGPGRIRWKVYDRRAPLSNWCARSGGCCNRTEAGFRVS